MHNDLIRSKIDNIETYLVQYENPEARKKLEAIKGRLVNYKYKIAIVGNKNAENFNALLGNDIKNVVVSIIDCDQRSQKSISELNKDNKNLDFNFNMLFVSLDFDQLDNEKSIDELFKTIKKIVENNQNYIDYFLIDKIELAFDNEQITWDNNKNQAKTKLKKLIESHKIREDGIFLISSNLALLKKNELKINHNEKKPLSAFEDMLKDMCDISGENYETILLKELCIKEVKQAIEDSIDNAKKNLLSNIDEEIEKIKNERDKHCMEQFLDKSDNSEQTFNQEIDSSPSHCEVKKEFTDNLQLELQPNYIGCSSDFCVIVTNQGVVKSIGDNHYGQLGIGNKDNQDKFMDVIDLPLDVECISVSVGYQHVLALLETGDVCAWGRGEEGELGDDTKDIRLSAFKVKGLPKDKKPIKIIAGANSSFVLLETGDLYVSGEIVNSTVFIEYPLPFKVKDVELLYDSDDNGIVVVNSKDEIFIKCFRSYSLDWCRSDDRSEWNLLRGLPEECTIHKIITGSNYLFTILSTGEVYAIGADNEGQLARGEYTSSSQETFTKIYSIKEKILQIATNKERSHTKWDSGCYSNFVLASTPSRIYGWGNNQNKQLGEQREYNTDSFTTGALLWKKTHTYRYYRDLKPKIINQFDAPMKDSIEYYIACTDNASIMFDRSQNKFYLLGQKIGAGGTNNIVTCIEVD